MNAVLVQMDQLSARSAVFRNRTPDETVVIFVEDAAELTVVPFHKQRITFILSAMRHFADALRDRGFTVIYAHVNEDPVRVIKQSAQKHGFDSVTVMHAASWGVDDAWHDCLATAGVETTFIENDMFMSNREGSRESLEPGTSVRMETFYRKLRKATGILMNGGEPAGKRWNFDKENRRRADAGLLIPEWPHFEPDAITQSALKDVNEYFPDHFGQAEPFNWPVTRDDALQMLDDFLKYRFADFGPYQDAMIDGEDALFHSGLSACINIGLLDPGEVCRKAERYYEEYTIPLSSVEGFIRQILGWREFVYQLYQANMPGYDALNELDADVPLPAFYWDGNTRMRCVAESVRPVIERGLSHHIQRLMITGNFALLAGVDPQALNRWYWLGFIDAWHWVVTPNVIGMATFADGGLMASKPYAASANYINRMSDYCKKCPFNPRKAIGEDACPFNSLYWDFLARNEKRLGSNPRLVLSYKNLAKKTKSELESMRKHAGAIRKRLKEGGDA
jgi:deoxyribodipyrimidine photolyase-related protein